MNINKDNIKFFQYDALQTKTLRNKWISMNKSDKELASLMKEIDEDHIKIEEEKCTRKQPRIGPEYQALIPEY